MKKFIFSLFLILFFVINASAQINIIMIKGDVKIRKGVSEEWQSTSVNTTLGLEDAVSVGPKSSAIIQVNNQKRITLPEQTIIEVSDLREITKDELLLKLAMDRILAVPPQPRRNDLMPAPSAVIHGEKKPDTSTFKTITNKDAAIKTLNGARFLFNNKYYGTCALRIKEVLRLIPNVPEAVEYKIMTATALSKLGLYDEALNEFNLLNLEELTAEQKSTVRTNIEDLRKRVKG